MITKMKLAIDNSGLKQTYIAEKIGVRYEDLSKYVRGTLKVPPEKMKAIAKLLGVKAEKLVGVVG